MMTDLFRIVLLIGVLLFIVLIIWLMRRGKLSLKYSLIWFLTGLVLLVCAIFPQLVRSVTELIGIYSEANAVFFIGVCFLLLIILFLTSVASGLSDRVRRLVQTQAMLEKRIRDLEEYVGKEKTGMKEITEDRSEKGLGGTSA